MVDATDLRGQTVLVTGGAGFIGSHIADALIDVATVRVLDNFSTGTQANVPANATILNGDVRDFETVRAVMDNVDTVFHQASIVSVQQSVETPLTTHQVNAAGTLNVLEGARAADARVVVASSAAIYGHPKATPIDEETRPRPTSPYGIDKLTADQYARRYHDLYDLPTVVLRPFNVYGPRQSAGDYSGVISVFRDQVQNGEPLTVHGDGEQTRDFVHIRDVVRAYLAAATTEYVGEAFNIGAGTAISINKLAETIRELGDTNPRIVHTESRPGDIRHSCADISKARELLSYQPRISLRNGLETLFSS